MNKRILKVFVGYQIISEFHSSEEIKKIMYDFVTPLVEEKLNIKVEFKFGDKFRVGEYLFSQVHDAIQQCEIAIFDISENNPNVLIEVGMAYGAKKFTIITKNNASKDNHKVPSDINAFIYLPYDNLNGVIQDIFNTIESYNKSHIPSHFYFKELWGFHPNDTVYIVCPELEEPDKRQNPELNEFLYLGKYGDIDSFLVLFSSISKLYPHINLKFCTGKEFNSLPGNPHSENLILIGGPDYNEITRYYIEKKKIIPYEFVEVGEEEIGIKHLDADEIFSASFENDGNLRCVKDYGFFIKKKNPANPNKRIFMVNGIHTYGVYGAAKCFSLHEDSESEIAKENCKSVIHSYGNESCFATIFSVDCVNSKIGMPFVDIKNTVCI